MTENSNGRQHVQVAIAYHTGYGHTGRQAEAVSAGALQVPDTDTHLLAVDELSDELFTTLDASDAIVFGSPTYMGSPSAVFKAFAEGTSAAWSDNLRWKDKIAAGFTNSKAINGDKLNTLMDFAILAAQHGMIWVGLASYAGWSTTTDSIEDLNRLGSWLGAMAQSNGDEGPGVAPPASDLRTAEALGRRVAEITHQHVRGRNLGPTDLQPSVEELEAYTSATSHR